jgi:hypothetical protein
VLFRQVRMHRNRPPPPPTHTQNKNTILDQRNANDCQDRLGRT